MAWLRRTSIRRERAGFWDGPRLLPGATSGAVPPAERGWRGAGGWTLAVRARALRLSGQLVAADLRAFGVARTEEGLRAVLAGALPADPVLLAALVEVLQLRDTGLVDDEVVAAVTRPWLTAAGRVPARVVEILAQARNLPPRRVQAIAVRTRQTGT